jgi:hypothetical protein
MSKRDSKLNQIAGRKPLDHVHRKGGDESKYQQRVSEPAVEGLAEKLPMENDFSNENLEIPAGPQPESSPTSPDVNLKLLPLGRLLRSFEASFQPEADVETHAPYEENHRWKKHDVENKVFVHNEYISDLRFQISNILNLKSAI